jgi:tRNA 5-methylaminomethyl-2-thiouridine biosynthesis bifunctional protein
MPLTVATTVLERATDGTPWSREFADVYHSSHGGLAQARHVFLQGNGLPARWAGRDAFAILETGFGLGLNFLATWHAWREDLARCARLHFVSVERAPFSRDDLAAALQPFAELADLSQALAARWPPPLAGLHRIDLEGGRVVLTLALGEAQALLPQLVMQADALYLDGFSPARNPHLWSPEIVRELARLSRPGATLATWTVAGGVRTALADAGFTVEKRAGFGGKREMLVGTRAGSAAIAAPTRRAVIVGAGLAGTLVADRLAARAWDVELLDARAAPEAPEVGLLRPVVNLRDALNAQVSRTAWRYALQFYRALQYDGYHLQWGTPGILQLAGDADESARFRAIVAAQGWPADVLRFVDASEAAALAGRAVAGEGWWFPEGAWIAPPSLATACIARAGRRVRRHTGRSVERIEPVEGGWRALDGAGNALADAPLMILANASAAGRLAPDARVALSRVRGQLTYLPPDTARALEIIVSGNGYVAPRPEGGHVAGATYQHDDPDERVRAADHRDNLARAESMLPGFAGAVHPMGLEGWTGFRTTVPDRLPVFGESAMPGLHFATGLGSRGLLWGPWGAELLASALEGEPWPALRDAAGAISPRRFLS